MGAVHRLVDNAKAGTQGRFILNHQFADLQRFGKLERQPKRHIL
ncbi:hypothetical protein AB7B92_03710 [Klebsiella pneumoniae]